MLLYFQKIYADDSAAVYYNVPPVYQKQRAVCFMAVALFQKYTFPGT